MKNKPKMCNFGKSVTKGSAKNGLFLQFGGGLDFKNMNFVKIPVYF